MRNLFRSTGIVAASTLASRFLGLARDILMAAMFSATGATDAFYVAFRIPNVARRFLAEGVFTVSFIPVYTGYLVGRGTEEAFDLARKVLTLLLAAASALTLLGIVFMPYIVRVIAPGFTDASQIGITVDMARIMFPFMFAVILLAFCMGLLNSHRYFFAPAFAPFVLNVGIITGILLFSGLFPVPLYGVAAGVILGSILQLALQVPFLAKTGFRMRIDFDFRHPGVRKLLRTSLPGIFSMGILQINTLVVTLLGSFLAAGSISYIYFSDRLHELVLGVFVVSIGNVILPEMSALAAEGKRLELMNVYRKAIGSALLVTIPAAAALMVAGFPIISVLFMHHRFTAADAEMTYRALLCASIGVPAFAVIRITNPALYALGEGRSPFYAACASLAVNACAGWALMQTELAHAGLTLGLSLASTVQMLVLMLFLKKRAGYIGLRAITLTALKCTAASGAMAIVVRLIAGLVDWRTGSFAARAACLTVIVGIGGALYLALCYLMRAGETREIMARILRRVR
ncbi:MAG: murein biosynthesis integral membrane protein MurJ [Spirochaetes bacterium]|nr:murein biosynthesis integral membrane protein MurJ [Spirochaetota bacterium]